MILWELPLERMRRGSSIAVHFDLLERSEELSEGFDLGPPVIQEPVIENAEIPHLSGLSLFLQARLLPPLDLMLLLLSQSQRGVELRRRPNPKPL